MMDRTIGYLREILSNYTDKYPEAQQIYDKINQCHFRSEKISLISLTAMKPASLIKFFLRKLNIQRKLEIQNGSIN